MQDEEQRTLPVLIAPDVEENHIEELGAIASLGPKSMEPRGEISDGKQSIEEFLTAESSESLPGEMPAPVLAKSDNEPREPSPEVVTQQEPVIFEPFQMIPPSSSPPYEFPSAPPSSQPIPAPSPKPEPNSPSQAPSVINNLKRSAELAEITEQPKAKKRNLNSIASSSVHRQFKSPLLATPKSRPAATPASPFVTPKPVPQLLSSQKSALETPAKRLSNSAGKPFRSPLLSSRTTPGAAAKPSTVALERKLQQVKQAHKIVSENAEEELVRLTKKWTKVAREVAEEMWGMVKDTGTVNAEAKEDDWGYTEKKKKAGDTSIKDGWGWDENYPAPEGTQESDDRDREGDVDDGSVTEAKEPEWSLGAMLTSMGIPPDMLGWNEEEGEFMDK